MKYIWIPGGVILLLTGLLGCTQPMGMKQGVGTVGGAAVGAALASQIGHGGGRVAAVAAGTMLGAALGNEMGLSMDRADMAYRNQYGGYVNAPNYYGAYQGPPQQYYPPPTAVQYTPYPFGPPTGRAYVPADMPYYGGGGGGGGGGGCGYGQRCRHHHH